MVFKKKYNKTLLISIYSKNKNHAKKEKTRRKSKQY